MPRFIWATRGSSIKDMEAAKAVVVYAKDIEEAKRKVLDDVAGALDPEVSEDVRQDFEDSYGDECYGDEWILNELNEAEDVR